MTDLFGVGAKTVFAGRDVHAHHKKTLGWVIVHRDLP